MRFDEIVSTLLREARQNSVANYTGFQKGGKKLTEQIELMDKVVAKIPGGKSAPITKVIKEFDAIKSEMDACQAKLEKVKEKVKTEIDQEFFDASDMVLTRVIETATMTLQFAKVTPPKSERKIAGGEKVELVFDEILKLIKDTKLAAQVTALKDSLYEIKETASVWRMPTVKPLEEGIVKDALSKMVSYLSGVFSKLFTSIKNWSDKFDSKSEATKEKLKEITAK